MEPGSSEFDQVAKLFREFADFKPEMIKAV
jgi:hypothetical protein